VILCQLARSSGELSAARGAFDAARYTLMSELATENRFEAVEAVRTLSKP
jgi:hypothetical protein